MIWALSTGVSILVGQSLGNRDERTVPLTERAGLLLMIAVPAMGPRSGACRAVHNPASDDP